MTRAERYTAVLDRFQSRMPEAQTELLYHDAFSLLVAVMLSAQCTDKRVNMVTPALLAAYPTAQEMARATTEELLQYIGSVSYPKSKAEHLIGMAQMLVEQFYGEVPNQREQLVQLPGVGRKTANVMLSVYFGEPAMAVDTHVFRVSERIGLTTNSHSPEATEHTLTRNIPRELWSVAHHWLILHGRYTCIARKPKCEECFLADLCRYAQKAKKKSGKIELSSARSSRA